MSQLLEFLEEYSKDWERILTLSDEEFDVGRIVVLINPSNNFSFHKLQSKMPQNLQIL